MISPEVFHAVRGIQIRTQRVVNDLLAGAYRSAYKGRGMEFEDVREYAPGDEVRDIDWNVTAKMNFPYVKNYREERELTVMLIVDVSSSTLFGSTGKQKNEFVAEIGSALALSAIRNQDKVGLILYDEEVRLYLPPQKGVKNVLRVVRELLVCNHRPSKTNLPKALEYFGRIHKRHGVCFIISDFIGLEGHKEISLEARRHDLTAISITDPREVQIPACGLMKLEDLESGEQIWVDSSSPQVRVHLEREWESMIKKNKEVFEKSGAGFIDIRTDQPYALALRKYFAKKEKRG